MMGILVPLALGFSNLPPSLLVPHLPSRAPSQCPCSLDTEMRPQRGGDEAQAQSLGWSPLRGAGGKAQEQRHGALLLGNLTRVWREAQDAPAGSTKGLGCSSVEEPLPGTRGALGAIPSTAKT